VNIENDMTNNKIFSKADVLIKLKPELKTASIEDIHVFTVDDWRRHPTGVLERVRESFSPKRVVVRSSSSSEDAQSGSMAGCFRTELNIDPKNSRSLSQAIENIIESYKKMSEDRYNQIIVQTQTESILMSGVVLTRALGTNSPYYIINYDDVSGKTTTVTSGIAGSMVCMFHSTNLPKTNKWHKLLKTVREIEGHFMGKPLDIEFAIKKNKEVVVFQVRVLAANKNLSIPDETHIKDLIGSMQEKFKRFSKRVPHLAGKRTIFGDMPDWNPAEMIGNRPNTLDYTLYSFLITDYVWHEARSTLGYKDVYPAELMISFGKRPYIDVRASFNSLIPACVPQGICEKLVNFYINKLESHPEKQDKVEFEIVWSCYNFSLKKQLQEIKRYGFDKEQTTIVKNSLLDLTNNILKTSKQLFERDMNIVHCLTERMKEIKKLDTLASDTPWTLLTTAYNLLQNCKKFGTLPFSRLARLAFIGKSILTSLRDEGIIENVSYHNFLNSIQTVASNFNEDLAKFQSGKLKKKLFFEKYSHLRPGTYDITAPRYDMIGDLFSQLDLGKSNARSSKACNFSSKEKNNINNAMRRYKLHGNSASLINFISDAIKYRELAKFEFTRTLSEALEYIALAGTKLGFSRKHLSNVDLTTLMKFRNPEYSDTKYAKRVIKQSHDRHKREKKWSDLLILPPVIVSEKDFEYIAFYKARPNFITEKTVQGATMPLDKKKFLKAKSLDKFIILLENADPGFDWIFSKKPMGIVTKYGGVASHMAIRCAEFGIPAAIGCGPTVYDNLVKSKILLIDCAKQVLEPLEV